MFLKKNMVNLLIIPSLIFLAWNKILSLMPMGEGGYMYITYIYPFNQIKNHLNLFFRGDIGVYIFFNFLGRPFFKDNLFFYQLTIFLTLLILGILFYFIVYELTNKRSIAFVSTILFSVNFNTTFEMVAFGSYANFFQRVFFLLLLFPSLLLFFKFINTKKKTYYIISLTLGLLSSTLAHFSFFYVLFLACYFLGLLFAKKMQYRELFSLFPYVIIYVLSNFLFVTTIPSIFWGGSWIRSESILVFVINNINEVSVQFFRQLTILSVPDVILRQIFSFLNISYSGAIYGNNGIQYLYLPVSIIYLTAGVFLYKKEQKLRPAIVASLLFFPFIFILNLYLRDFPVITRLEPGNRFSFVPGVSYAIFWGIFLSHFVKNKTNMMNQFGVSLVMFGWIILQLIAIDRQLHEQSPNHIATKKIISYFKNDLSLKLRDDSIVITPYLMGNWGSDYLNMFYGKKNTTFIPRMTPEIELEAEIKHRSVNPKLRSFDPQKDFIISYDYDKEKVVDLTSEYKSIIKTE